MGSSSAFILISAYVIPDIVSPPALMREKTVAFSAEGLKRSLPDSKWTSLLMISYVTQQKEERAEDSAQR